MNIASGGLTVLGCAAGAALLQQVDPQRVLAVAAGLSALSLLVVAAGVRERPIGPLRRPGLRSTWATNALLFADPGRRALLLNLWVPNGLVVGCEALFVPFAPERAGVLLAAASAGMMAATWWWGGSSRPRCATGWRSGCGCCWRCRSCCSRSDRRRPCWWWPCSRRAPGSPRRCRCRSGCWR
ncbi:hypothetical protein ACFQ1I_05480 [Kitasatospora arboriphila]